MCSDVLYSTHACKIWGEGRLLMVLVTAGKGTGKEGKGGGEETVWAKIDEGVRKEGVSPFSPPPLLPHPLPSPHSRTIAAVPAIPSPLPFPLLRSDEYSVVSFLRFVVWRHAPVRLFCLFSRWNKYNLKNNNKTVTAKRGGGGGGGGSSESANSKPTAKNTDKITLKNAAEEEEQK